MHVTRAVRYLTHHRENEAMDLERCQSRYRCLCLLLILVLGSFHAVPARTEGTQGNAEVREAYQHAVDQGQAIVEFESSNVNPMDTLWTAEPYQEFLRINRDKWTPMLEDELQKSYQRAKDVLSGRLSAEELHGQDLPGTPEEMANEIVRRLGIGFLIDGMNATKLTVTTVKAHQFSTHIEHELVFHDPHVGLFRVLLLVPGRGEGRYPAILGIHGHNDSPEVFRDKYFSNAMVKAGFAVIIPSLRAMGCDDKEEAISRELYLKGFTLMGLRVYETMLVLKYLKYSERIDENRIGVMGHSGGSCVIYLLSRISRNVKAAIVDDDLHLLDHCDETDSPTHHMHCQTIPSLVHLYADLQDTAKSPIPLCRFAYGYPEREDAANVIRFFEEKLGSGRLSQSR